MALTIAGIQFASHDYDERGDTLYLGIGESRKSPPAKACETTEGHVIEYDSEGRVIGLELLNVRWTLERQGELTLTWPEEHVAADALAPVLAVA